MQRSGRNEKKVRRPLKILGVVLKEDGPIPFGNKLILFSPKSICTPSGPPSALSTRWLQLLAIWITVELERIKRGNGGEKNWSCKNSGTLNFYEINCKIIRENLERFRWNFLERSLAFINNISFNIHYLFYFLFDRDFHSNRYLRYSSHITHLVCMMFEL